MKQAEFDAELVRAAFDLAAMQGWRRVSAAAAAREAGLDLARARRRFPCTPAILSCFGRLADEAALTGALTEGPVKDRLFDVLMRRVDFLQRHRDGVVALMRPTAADPALSLWLAARTLHSMGWMLEAAGVSSQGIRGELRKQGLCAVWTWTLRAWLRDDSEDLATTMAALDTALGRADQVAAQFGGGGAPDSDAPESEEPPQEEPPAEDASFTSPGEDPDRPE